MSQNKQKWIPFYEFVQMREEHDRKVSKTVSKLLNLKPIPPYAGIMTLDDYIKEVTDRPLNERMSTGYYSTEYGVSNKRAIPSDIRAGNIDRKWTHVALL